KGFCASLIKDRRLTAWCGMQSGCVQLILIACAVAAINPSVDAVNSAVIYQCALSSRHSCFHRDHDQPPLEVRRMTDTNSFATVRFSATDLPAEQRIAMSREHYARTVLKAGIEL